ncbi:MAG: hypothetical protein M3Z26_01590 [Bacteroidota bacterium]|nr:hypothetical protein [Bacteroidota bacterium]
MKKLLLIALTFSFFALNANAQTTRNVNPSQKVRSHSSHKKSKMMKDLNLSPSQKSQMKELHQGMKQQKDVIKNDASLTPEQKKAKMKELHETQKGKMNSILTPDQQAKMKADKKEWKENKKSEKTAQN